MTQTAEQRLDPRSCRPGEEVLVERTTEVRGTYIQPAEVIRRAGAFVTVDLGPALFGDDDERRTTTVRISELYATPR